MKHLILTLFFAVASIFGASAQSKFYEACRANDDFKTVYVGKSMLRLVKSSGGVNNMDIVPLIDKIDSIIIVSAESKDAAAKLKALANSFFSTAKGYQIMVDSYEKGEQMTTFSKALEKKQTEYVLISDESGNSEFNVIVITGTLTPEEIKNIK